MARNEAKIVLSAEDRASRVLGNMRQELIGLQGAGARLGAVLGPLGGIAAAAAALGAGGLFAVKNFAAGLDDLAEKAAGLGVGAVALAEMQSKAAEAGVEAGQLELALGKLNSKITDAAAGNKQAAATFAAMGISLRDANGQIRGTEDVLRDVAERFRGYANTAELGALAADLFGERAGRKLVAYLQQGGDGLRQFTGITEESVAEAQRFQAQVDKLSTSLERLRNQALAPLVSGANWLIDLANRVPAATKRVAELEAEIVRLEASLDRRDAGSALFDGTRARIEKAREELEKFRQAAALDARRLLFGDVGYGDRTARAPVPQKDEPEKRKLSAADQFLKRLQEQAVAASYTAEQVLRIEAAQLGVSRAAEPWIASLSAARAQAADLAAQIAAADERERERNASAERATAAWLGQVEAARQLARAGESAEDTLARQLAEIEKLNDSGAFLAAAGQDAARAWVMYGNAVDAAYDAHRRLEPEAEKAVDYASRLGLTFSSAFEDAIVSGRRLSEVLRSLQEDLLRMITRSLITEPLANSITGNLEGLGTGSGFFGNLFEAIGSFVGFGATGIKVPAGKWAIAGERGPEPVFGGSSGATVLPNAALGGGAPVQVALSVVNNGPPVQARVQQRQMAGGVMIDLILDELTADINRGGRTSRAISQRFALNPAAGLAR